MPPRVKKIQLVTQSFVVGSRLQKVPKDTVRNVFAKIDSVTQTEYFAASAEGFTPSGKATIWAFEYHGEKILVLDGKRYAIYRTYLPENRKIELYYMFEAGPGTSDIK